MLLFSAKQALNAFQMDFDADDISCG